MLTFGVLIGIFQLKVALGGSISISVKTLCVGGAIAIAIGSVDLIISIPSTALILSYIPKCLKRGIQKQRLGGLVHQGAILNSKIARYKEDTASQSLTKSLPL